MSLAMADGAIDWSNLAIGDPQRNFVDREPANRYFILEEGPNMANLAMMIDRVPFDDPNVRKAISMAINRDQVSMIGESGVVSPADVTGLSKFYESWKVSDPASLSDWATYNVDKANELLDAAGLARGADGIEGSRMDAFPHELSGGMRQRVVIAIALALKPPMMIMDEPISMLDVSIRMDVLNLMEKLKEERGIGFLYITHDLASARYIGDRTIVMYAGHDS